MTRYMCRKGKRPVHWSIECKKHLDTFKWVNYRGNRTLKIGAIENITGPPTQSCHTKETIHYDSFVRVRLCIDVIEYEIEDGLHNTTCP